MDTRWANYFNMQVKLFGCNCTHVHNPSIFNPAVDTFSLGRILQSPFLLNPNLQHIFALCNFHYAKFCTTISLDQILHSIFTQPNSALQFQNNVWLFRLKMSWTPEIVITMYMKTIRADDINEILQRACFCSIFFKTIFVWW